MPNRKPLDAADLKAMFSLPPAEAIDFLQRKELKITWGWRDMAAEAHATAFTVAGITRMDVLADIHQGLLDALKEGKTEREFIRDLKPLLEQKGWWGKHAQTDTDTGEMAGKGLDEKRLKLIFQTNMQKAFNAGRDARFRAVEARYPYARYVAVMDAKTRPSHAALNGRTFRADDPFWRHFSPPLGFNCRCRKEPLSSADLIRGKIDLSSSQGRLSQFERPVGKTGRTEWATRFEYAPGKYIAPDPGWAGNAASGHLANLGMLALTKAERLPPPIAALAVNELLANPVLLSRMAADFAQWAGAIKVARGEWRHVGAVSPDVLRALTLRGIAPESALLTVRDEDVLHTLRDSKVAPLARGIYLDLPRWLAQPQAVLLEKGCQPPVLLYVFDVAEDKASKLVVKADYDLAARDAVGKKQRIKANIVRSGTVIHDLTTLRDPTRYQLLSGGV